MMEYDIVKKGNMHLKRPASNAKLRLRAWIEKFIVLRDSSFDRSARLEIYTNSDHVGEDTKECDIIDLKDVVQIGNYSESSKFPHALMVSSDKHSPLILASDNENFVREWSVAIRCLTAKERSRSAPRVCSRRESSPLSGVGSASGSKRGSGEPPAIFQDILNGKFTLNNNKDKNTTFPVEVQTNCSSLQNKLSGDYNMRIRVDTIVLVDIDNGKEIHKWPIANVKKFKSEPATDNVDLVTIETGLHSKIGEGIFVFRTNHGEEIVRQVRSAAQVLQRRGSHSQEKIQQSLSLSNSHGSGTSRSSSLTRSSHSSSSPNIHSLSGPGRMSASGFSSISPRGCSTPPPVPPRRKTNSAPEPSSSRSSTGGLVCEISADAHVFSPGPDEAPEIHYACLDQSNTASVEDLPKHDDSGYSESSDDTSFPLDSPSVQKQKTRAPPATLPRMKKRESGSYRPPPLPPSVEDEQEKKPSLPPRRKTTLP